MMSFCHSSSRSLSHPDLSACMSPTQVANLESFDLDRTISLVPSEGEFALMNYRASMGFKPPFRLQCSVDSDPGSPLKANLVIKLW